MPTLRIVIFLAVLYSANAAADIWKWVDSEGKTHFVDTQTAIYTWVDDSGKTYYSDTPDHEDAVSVELVWVSKGTLDDDETAAGSDASAYAGETAEERMEREDAEAYYCKRATEIYDSYKNAPRLYRTNENGEREYLSDADAKATLEETRQKMDELCS